MSKIRFYIDIQIKTIFIKAEKLQKYKNILK